MTEPIEEPVPKLPRGRGFRFSGPELFRIAITIVTLVGVVVLTRPCANAVSSFVTGFDEGSNQQSMPKPGTVDPPAPPQQYEQLKPGMTEQEIKAAIERSKARNAASAQPNAGSAQPNAGSAQPNAGSAQPNAGSAQPNAGSAQPTKSSPTEAPAKQPPTK